jgi:hypothetical protein
MLVDAPPAIVAPADPAPAPVIPGPDGSPHYLLGVIAYGSEKDVERLEKVAKRQGWPAERDPDGSNGDTVKLIIMFPRADPREVARFLDRSNKGEFGRFSFESMVLPVRAAGSPVR